MSLWRVTLFDSRKGEKPSRIGYLFADTQEAASAIASAEKTSGVRVDIKPTIMRPAQMTSAAQTIYWDD